jgi:hypothetical protein
MRYKFNTNTIKFFFFKSSSECSIIRVNLIVVHYKGQKVIVVVVTKNGRSIVHLIPFFWLLQYDRFTQ